MSLNAAFFHTDGTDQDVSNGIGFNISNLIQVNVPTVYIDEKLTRVQQSNFGFVIPMDWALNGAERKQRLSNILFEKLSFFENRIFNISNINIEDDNTRNCIMVSITCEVTRNSSELRYDVDIPLA